MLPYMASIIDKIYNDILNSYHFVENLEVNREKKLENFDFDFFIFRYLFS